MKRYKVTVKCFGWKLSTCVVDAPDEIAAYHEARRVHMEHAEKIGDAGFYVEPWDCVEVTL